MFARWSARSLAIAFALFISLFALDVFDEGESARDVALALLIHLVPTYLLIIALLIAWRWELAGAACYALLGALSIAFFHWDDPVAFLLIPGPIFLIGMLFAIAWRAGRSSKRIREP